jgi:hypothetical protein
MSKHTTEACVRHNSEFARKNRDGLRISRVYCFRGRERQANLNHQAALRTIRYPDRPAVQAHGTIRDG